VDAAQLRRRARSKLFWRIVNPPARLLAGFAPWWLLLETVGRRTGQARRTPLATGPRDAAGMWLIASHGRHSHYVGNLIANPRVRLRYRGRWRVATASVHDLDPAVVARANPYAREALRLAIDPCLVRLDYV
jgi:deazaflavin-dependent oxidoreductase (nitroreductase family)